MSKFYGYSRVELAGRATEDAESITLPSGTLLAKFSVAVNHKKDEGADFFNVVAFNEQAQAAEEIVKKGKVVKVQGRLQTRSYEDQNGSKHKVTEVIAYEISSFRKKEENQAEEEKSRSDKQAKKAKGESKPIFG